MAIKCICCMHAWLWREEGDMALFKECVDTALDPDCEAGEENITSHVFWCIDQKFCIWVPFLHCIDNLLLFNHMGWFHEYEKCHLYFAGTLSKTRIFVVIYTFMLTLVIWVELYSQHYSHDASFILTLFVGNIVRPNINHSKYYLEQHHNYKY